MAFRSPLIRLAFLALILLFSGITAKGQYETIPSGSYIIDMGDPNPSIATHLKPYGLIYDLVENFNVSVKWIIKPGKEKDSVDFTHNGRDYRAGPFIIPETFITPEVDSVVNYWQNTMGVLIDTTVSAISLPVYFTITSFPTTVLDLDNGSKVVPFYTNAGIPSSSYRMGLPKDLTPCDGVYVMPHADPTWSTHKELYDFIIGGGYLWASCHAVSVLESIKDTSTPPQQYNYLSQDGLQCYKTSKCGWVSESHNKNPSTPLGFAPGIGDDPVMQFLGTADGAMNNGSEQWYKPLSTGGWNSGAKKLMVTSDDTGSQQGVRMIYGYAFDDTSYGRVMYQAGHDNTKGPLSDQIAAQRAFFNFLLLTGHEKSLEVSVINSSPIITMSGDTFGVSVASSQGNVTFSWSANVPGTFSNPYDSIVVFTPDSGLADSTVIVLTVLVSDNCNATNFQTISSFYRDPVALLPIKEFIVKYTENKGIYLKWSVTDPNPAYEYVIQRKAGYFKAFENIDTVGGEIAKKGFLEFYDRQYPESEKELYYRILELSDGRIIDRSSIESVRLEDKTGSGLFVFPVPVRDQVSLRFSGMQGEAVDISLYDDSGRWILSRHYEDVVKGSNTIRLDMGYLPGPALYLLVLQHANGSREYAKIFLSAY